MQCSIFLIAVMASLGLTAPTAGGPTHPGMPLLDLESVSIRDTALLVVSFLLTASGHAAKRTTGDTSLQSTDVLADDEAIKYRWNAAYAESDKETNSDEVSEEAQ